MVLTIHQPAYLPWLGYFHRIAASDIFVLLDDVQFERNSFINRNRIKTPQGSTWLTVPVLMKGHLSKTIGDMEINNSQPWTRKHWNAIFLNYKKAPYFKLYSEFFEDVYAREWKLLADLNFFMLKWFLKTLDIRIEISKASEGDFQGHKSDLVLDMCLKLKANVHIFGALGKDYAEVEKFNRSGVTPVFQSYSHPVYRQLHGNFIPGMSTLDLLFNEGPKSLDILMSGNIRKGDIKT